MNKNKLKKEAKELLREKDYVLDSDGNVLITAKASGGEQIFSQFDYDRSEKLNPELSDYIYEKASHAPAKANLRLKIYTFENVNESEVRLAIKKNYEREYKNERHNLRSNWKLIFSVTILGILMLSLLFLCYAFFNNAYVTTILEIIVWVLFWEAVDAFVFSRSKMRRKSFLLLKLCTCEVEIVKISKNSKKMAK